MEVALYDPNEFPEAEVKTGADFTLTDVLAWARTKPASASYSYIDPGNCALCQFLRDTGRAITPRVAGNEWRDGIQSKDYRQFDTRLDWAANGDTNEDETFGAFAGRLETALVR